MISKWNVSNIINIETYANYCTHTHMCMYVCSLYGILTACAYIVIESANRQEFSIKRTITFISLHCSFFFHPFILSSDCRCFVPCDCIDHFNVYHHGRPRINARFQYFDKRMSTVHHQHFCFVIRLR